MLGNVHFASWRPTPVRTAWCKAPEKTRRRTPPAFRIRSEDTENTRTTLEEEKENEFVERLRALKEEPEPDRPAVGFWQEVVEEASLINWPPLGKAILQTLLVIGIVAGTSLLLFAVNASLTDLSKWYYSR